MPKIITGYTSTPHVTSDDAAAFQQGIVGYDDYALASENQLTAVTVESSRLRLSKAEIVIQGVHVRLDGRKRHQMLLRPTSCRMICETAA